MLHYHYSIGVPFAFEEEILMQMAARLGEPPPHQIHHSDEVVKKETPKKCAAIMISEINPPLDRDIRLAFLSLAAFLFCLRRFLLAALAALFFSLAAAAAASINC